MSMTRDEAIKWLEEIAQDTDTYWESCSKALQKELDEQKQVFLLALSALRPITREQVERMRGEWVAKHRHRGGFRRVTGVDDMGEQHEVTIDERCEYDDRYCSKCGKQSPDNFLNFCCYCGAPMTDEAVEILVKRMEEMRNG